ESDCRHLSSPVCDRFRLEAKTCKTSTGLPGFCLTDCRCGDAMSRKRESGRSIPTALPSRPETDDTRENALVFYDELLQTRDRLAGLPPPTRGDLERVMMAMHEVFFYLMTPPPDRKTELTLPEATTELLVRAARDRDIDLYVLTIALLAH